MPGTANTGLLNDYYWSDPNNNEPDIIEFTNWPQTAPVSTRVYARRNYWEHDETADIDAVNFEPQGTVSYLPVAQSDNGWTVAEFEGDEFEFQEYMIDLMSMESTNPANAYIEYMTLLDEFIEDSRSIQIAKRISFITAEGLVDQETAWTLLENHIEELIANDEEHTNRLAYRINRMLDKLAIQLNDFETADDRLTIRLLDDQSLIDELSVEKDIAFVESVLNAEVAGFSTGNPTLAYLDRVDEINEEISQYLSGRLLNDGHNKADGIISTFAIDQVYPNPFNSSTTIQFSLPAQL